MSSNIIGIPAVVPWPHRTLGDLAHFISRGSAPSYVEASDCRAIGQRCVTNEYFDASWSRPHDSTKVESVLEPQVGDILVNSTGTGTIGRSVVFPGGGWFIVDSHITVLRMRKDLVNPHWLNSVLRSPWGQSHMESQCYSGSTNQVELSRVRLMQAEVPVPPLGEQERIVSVIRSYEEMASIEQARLEKLRKMKAGLTADLLTGRVRVNQLDELPV